MEIVRKETWCNLKNEIFKETILNNIFHILEMAKVCIKYLDIKLNSCLLNNNYNKSMQF